MKCMALSIEMKSMAFYLLCGLVHSLRKIMLLDITENLLKDWSFSLNSLESNEWDPPVEHVAINKNSLTSAVYSPWNASSHSGDNINASIAQNAATKNLSVNWKFKASAELKETTSLSYQIDLKEVLPQWVTIGFSAATDLLCGRPTHPAQFRLSAPLCGGPPHPLSEKDVSAHGLDVESLELKDVEEFNKHHIVELLETTEEENIPKDEYGHHVLELEAKSVEDE
ncbi:hypothetical protein FEM48_Zijuj09G0199200 [Ziziphus jujuba var. spinosa]|uniref:Legume lectin domain-containing protein n=1 Tax=Ziziphus jujuba var. spinosa TaxID=714518 RepID=A0A978UV03_ZIZJJ|nr:hypothetical protein FEM48_Zijuj09G0199200 [Ziziphus jujuba var. spinosa]